MSAFPGLLLGYSLVLTTLVAPVWAADAPSTPEGVLRALVRANAAQDLPAMAALMSRDSDSVGYSIGGRKYVGWTPFAREMEQEFALVEKLEIPITELITWTRGDVAWFAMELDYTRYVQTAEGLERTVLPLRETGVLERRGGRWVVVSWHESRRNTPVTTALIAESGGGHAVASRAGGGALPALDLSGEWLVEEEDKSYTASLDREGNGSYSHQGGTFRTVKLENRRLLGTWHQPGNDREGGFEVVFSEDGREARGVWWYTRVGSRDNIPPRLHGGTYTWRRIDTSETGRRPP